MKVKRFVALDMRSALTRIREEFSADAVILSSRNITGGGVEVLAAFNEAEARTSSQPEADVAQRRAPAAGRTPVDTQGEEIDAARRTAPGAAKSAVKDQQLNLDHHRIRESLAQWSRGPEPVRDFDDAAETAGQRQGAAAEDPAVGALRSELSSIRTLLEQRLSGLSWEQFARRTPVQALIWERLNRIGMPGFLSRNLLEQVAPEHGVEEAWRFVLATLNRSIPVFREDIIAQGGVFALLGPTGAGKTTTIGKLASRFVLENGPQDLALVTTDSYRVAAHEQLRAFGRILGVSVRIVDDKHTLQQTLHSLRDKRLVLIDTAGLSPQASEMHRQLDELRAQQQVQNLLVLACTSHGQVLRSVMKTWSGLQLKGCILTRLDEAALMGDALALAIDHKLAIAYETFGQAIPDDIRVAQAHRLVSRAVALSKHAETDREQLMSDFANNFSLDPRFAGHAMPGRV